MAQLLWDEESGRFSLGVGGFGGVFAAGAGMVYGREKRTLFHKHSVGKDFLRRKQIWIIKAIKG